MTSRSEQKLETNSAEIFFPSEGYIRVNIKPSVKQNLRDAEENMNATCRESKTPLLLDLRGAQPVDPEVRRFYSGQVLVDHFSSLAILIDLSPVTRMMANVYVKVTRPPIPTKIFTDEKSAIDWTKSFLK